MNCAGVLGQPLYILLTHRVDGMMPWCTGTGTAGTAVVHVVHRRMPRSASIRLTAFVSMVEIGSRFVITQVGIVARR